MSESQPSVYSELTYLDIWEILRVPALLALAAIAGTWAVWYFTSMSCPRELALTIGCNPSQTAQYISLDALNKMVTHAVIAGGGGGIWSYAMITRERKAREAADKAREAAEKRLTEALESAAEERRQFLAIIEDLNQRLAERHNGGDGAAQT